MRGGALSAVGYACVPCARSKNEYFLRLARAATADRRRGSLVATRATGRIRRNNNFDLNDCYTITMAGYVLSMVRSFSGYQRAEI